MNEIIKERMLRALKESVEDQWAGGSGERDKVLSEIYLTDPNGCCINEDYLGDDVLIDIQEKFYWYLDAIRQEFDEFIEIYVMPSYDDATAYFMIYDNKLLYRGSCKAWNFFFQTEEELMEDMHAVYLSIAAKMEKTWEMWTLSEEDIKNAAEAHDILLDGADLDDVANRFYKCFAELVGLNWDECLADCIKESIKDTKSPELVPYQEVV